MQYRIKLFSCCKRTCRLATTSSSLAQYAYLNSALGAASDVSVIGANAFTLTRQLDGRHRLSRFSIDGHLHAAYTYDAENRLAAVSNDAFTVSYAYTTDGLDAGWTLTVTNGTVISRALTRDNYRRTLVTTITNWVNGTPVTTLSYTHDALGRITSRNSDTFGYNSRSEVISADIQSTASRYAYDGIGNNLWTSVNITTNVYTANSLNQYAAINATQLAYDGDGSLLTNGVWSYTWDSENRLKAGYNNSVCVVSNAYDHAHRRVLKVTPTTTFTYLYDGWNLVQETVQTLQSTVTNRFVWGRDLSGSLQGAGDIGGLLAVQMSGSWYFPLFDHNGNATHYVGEQGSIAAQYTYDAFGRTLTATGPHADAFRHRFSTKYLDVESGLYYYGYRFYAPELMRWLSRDPTGEMHDKSLYGFTRNSPIAAYDSLGLRTVWIQMNYRMPSLGTIPSATREEVNRILQNCVNKRVARSKKGKPCHSVKLFWWQVTSKPASLGFSGGDYLTGYNPTFADVYLEEWTSPLLGHTGDWHVSVNLPDVQSVSTGEGSSFDRGLATVIAHETFLHAVGGKFGHYHWSGFVDASKGLIGGELSDGACKLLCDRLDID